MNIIYLISSLIFLCVVSVSAQNAKISCPKVAVFGPDSVIQAGQIMIFEARISEKEKTENFTYNWMIDKGTIIKGQGTKIIQVSTEGLSDTIISAAVEVEMPNIQCEIIDSEVGVVGQRLEIDPLDRYGEISWEDEQARLDSFLVSMQQNPGYKGYVWITSAKNESIINLKKYIRKLVRHIKFRKISPSKIIFAIEKSEYRQTTIIIFSECAELPKCEDCQIIIGSDLQ